MTKIDKKNIEDILGLTPLQEGMLFHYLKEPAGEHYFEQLCLEICGEIEPYLFEKAWNAVVDANEMLRTVFHWEKMENPVQMVLKKHKLKPLFYAPNEENLSERKPGQDLSKNQVPKDEWLEAIKIKERAKTFDLRDVPFRVALCKLEDDKYEMIISNHHILYDGWSNGIILEEFFNTYNNLAAGKKLLKPLKEKFKKYVKWLQDRDETRQEQFWKEYFSDFDTSPPLTFKGRNAKDLKGTGNCKIGFRKETTERLREFVREHKITLAALLYTGWGILLQKYAGSEDVVFGTTVSGRPPQLAGIENIVGLFINTLPLRVREHPGETVRELLTRINKAIQGREEYESTPLVRISEHIGLSGTQELFDTIVVIENYPLDRRLREAEGRISPRSYTIHEATHYDLTLAVSTFEGLEVEFISNIDVLGEEILRQLARHYLAVVEAITLTPDREAHRLEILSEEEKRRLLIDCNIGASGYPADKSIHELFERQVEKTPDHIAVNAGAHALSYRRLDEAARRIAAHLRTLGVEKNRLAGRFRGEMTWQVSSIKGEG